mmetsp:Transcript_72806/g.236509  ORF Transcript_72806/g.236509 Transcript_72806/m.236509 type:complete len:224 (+) Transcript_72806:63-734(+)
MPLGFGRGVCSSSSSIGSISSSMSSSMSRSSSSSSVITTLLVLIMAPCSSLAAAGGGSRKGRCSGSEYLSIGWLGLSRDMCIERGARVRHHTSRCSFLSYTSSAELNEESQFCLCFKECSNVTHAFPQEWETVDVEAHVVRQRRIDLLDRIFIAGAGAAGLVPSGEAGGDGRRQREAEASAHGVGQCTASSVPHAGPARPQKGAQRGQHAHCTRRLDKTWGSL